MSKKTTQHIVNKNIYELVESGYNPRKISDTDFEALKQSLLSFGAVQPAVVNINIKRYNIIIGGHQRIRAASKLDWQVYPCIEVDLDKDREKELNIRLNRGGDFDFDLLQEYFKAEDLVSYGFSPDSVDFSVPEFIENNTLGLSGNTNDIYGGNSTAFRFGNMVAYIKDEEIIKQMNSLTNKVVENDEDQRALNEFGLKIVRWILKNEDVFLSKI